MIKFFSSRRAFAILFIAFAVAMYFLGTNYFKQADRIEAADEQIAQLTLDIAQTQHQIGELGNDADAQLAQLDSELTAVSSLMPTDIVANEVVRTILDLGDLYNVTVVPLTNNDWSDISLADSNYRRLRITIIISGSWDSLINFLDAVQNTDYATLACEDLSTTISDQQGITTNLVISIYTK